MVNVPQKGGLYWPQALPASNPFLLIAKHPFDLMKFTFKVMDKVRGHHGGPLMGGGGGRVWIGH